jgi:glyoxylase-like metal-dependent hydrolase (beta-lactamase superfamily II)
MKKLFVIAMAVATVLSLRPVAQDAPQNARAAIDAAAAAMGTVALQSVQYFGTGSVNPTGQAFTSGGPWPRFTVTKYTMSVNFTVPAMRQELVRIDNQRPTRGGGAGGFNPGTGQGGIRPIPGDIIQNQTTDGRTEAGALNIWLTPHGFLKGAAANVATATASTVRGKRVVAFTAGKHTVSGTLSDRNLVERVETRMDVSFTGDTLVEGIYSDYRDFGGVQFPMRIVMQQGGFPILDLVLTDVRPNSPAALEVGANPQRGGGPAGAAPVQAEARPAPERIADGVWFMTPGEEGSILVEFNDHLVMVEGPGNDAQTMAALANAKMLASNKPVRYVINTHHHADHAGGLRAFVAEGIPIVTHDTHERYFQQQIFRNPHTLNPDRLARAPRAPIIETIKDRRVFSDGKMTLELHLLRDQPHSEGLLVAYIPRERLLIQADAFHPRPGAKPLPAPSPYTINLVENIARLKLDVARVVHVHGGISPFVDVLRAAGR